jgi:hypothetical protein
MTEVEFGRLRDIPLRSAWVNEARSAIDGATVLIENQLEVSDPGHLGQVMTYLAGLQAKVIIWIAPAFRDQHRSAIRWLNLNTAEGFSFFAVRLRVVQIGSSPLAPIFEVVERPNTWERQVKQTATNEGSAYCDVKQDFWRALLEL